MRSRTKSFHADMSLFAKSTTNQGFPAQPAGHLPSLFWGGGGAGIVSTPEIYTPPDGQGPPRGLTGERKRAMGTRDICSQPCNLENWRKGSPRARAGDGAIGFMICASLTETCRRWSALGNLGTICIYLFVILTCEITPFTLPAFCFCTIKINYNELEPL